MKTTISLFLLLLLTISLESCSDGYLDLKNQTGGSIQITYDGSEADTIENSVSLLITYTFKLGEKTKNTKVTAEGSYISLATNIEILTAATLTLNLSANRGGITITNASGKSITNVNISSTSGSWGSNYLTNPILNGENRTFSYLPAGSYSIRVIDSAVTGTTSGVTVTNGAPIAKTWNGASII